MDRHVLWFFLWYYFIIEYNSEQEFDQICSPYKFVFTKFHFNIYASFTKKKNWIYSWNDWQTDRQTRRKQTRQTEAMSHSSLVRGFITEMKFVFICLEPRSFQCLNNFRLWQYSHYLFFNTSILGKNIASLWN